MSKAPDQDDSSGASLTVKGAPSDHVLERLKAAVNANSDRALADALDLRPSAISTAKTRQTVPPSWVLTAATKYNISADWIWFGVGPMKRGEAAETEALPAGLPPLPVYQGPCQRCEWLEQDLKIEREERRELQQELREMREERRTLADENRGLLKANADLRVELERLRPRAGPDETCNGDKDDLQQSA